MPARTTVHYLHSSTLIGGGNKVLLRLIDGLDRTRFSPYSILPRTGPMTEELVRRGILVKHIGTNQPGSVLQHLLGLAELSAHLYRHRRALVHANDPFTYALCRRSLSPSSVPWICHVHHPGVGGTTLAWAFRRPPALILTPSRYVAGQLTNRLDGPLEACRDDIRTVFNPIDTEFFSPADHRESLVSQLGLNPRRHHLVTAGAITAHKGQDLFVRIVELLCDRGLPVEGHIVGAVQPGSEAYEASVRRLVAESTSRAPVTFHGFLADEEVRDLFRAADVFVLPTAEEGFGLVLAEAQACGTPVVTTAIPPLDEVVQHDRTGYLVERSAESMADAVAAILTKPGLRAEMSEAARPWVEGSFGARAFCHRIANAYDAVLAGLRVPD